MIISVLESEFPSEGVNYPEEEISSNVANDEKTKEIQCCCIELECLQSYLRSLIKWWTRSCA